jgi:hypothetical protein
MQSKAIISGRLFVKMRFYLLRAEYDPSSSQVRLAFFASIAAAAIQE